jgi:hypothetical protein
MNVWKVLSKNSFLLVLPRHNRRRRFRVIMLERSTLGKQRRRRVETQEDALENPQNFVLASTNVFPWRANGARGAKRIFTLGSPTLSIPLLSFPSRRFCLIPSLPPALECHWILKIWRHLDCSPGIIFRFQLIYHCRAWKTEKKFCPRIHTRKLVLSRRRAKRVKSRRKNGKASRKVRKDRSCTNYNCQPFDTSWSVIIASISQTIKQIWNCDLLCDVINACSSRGIWRWEKSAFDLLAFDLMTQWGRFWVQLNFLWRNFWA